MYGDTDAIRALAGALNERATDIRREADRLLGEAGSVAWSGLAADALRRRSTHRAAGLHRAAALHEDAAQALERHAREVDRLTELIAALERRATRLVRAARDRLAGLGAEIVDGLPLDLGDAADEVLDRFVPPPPGSRQWLQVDLPGLR